MLCRNTTIPWPEGNAYGRKGANIGEILAGYVVCNDEFCNVKKYITEI